MTTAYSSMYPGDVTFLDSVESYLRKTGMATNLTTPQERLVVTEQARAALYSYDVQCMPRIADKLLNSGMDTDQEARALWIALRNHVMDPVFVQVLMQFLASRNDPSLNGQIGALLSNVIKEFYEEHYDDKKKKEDTLPEFDEVKHIQAAIEQLLGGMANAIQVRCGGLTHPEALFVAACVAMNSKESIKEILMSDLSITADVFGNLKDPDRIIRAALLLLKSEVPTKPTKNQTAFLDSLKRWVYTMLDAIPGGTVVCYQYLVGVYGSVKPEVSQYFIQLKDCGTTYPNCLAAAKQIVNK